MGKISINQKNTRAQKKKKKKTKIDTYYAHNWTIFNAQ